MREKHRNRSEIEMPATGVVQLSAVERKLQSKANGVKRAKSFSSTSAPTSPSALRRNKQPTVEPRYTKSTHLLMEAKRLAKEIEERKKNGSLLHRPQSAKTVNLGPSSRLRSGSGDATNGTKTKRPSTAEPSLRIGSPALLDGRLSQLRGSGRKRNYVVPTSQGKTCDECQRNLKSGFYSEHQGLPYCNVPCYTSLFSSLLNRCFGDGDSCSSLSDEQKQLRKSLIPKLRTYNTYYSGRPCQIACREINDKFILEGVIKVYWGLRSPVTLADSEVSHYWKHFQPDDGGKKDNTENVPPSIIEKTKKIKSSALRRAKNSLTGIDSKYKYKRKESGGSSEHTHKRRLGCSVCSHELLNGENTTTFIPPFGTPTTLRLTNHVAVPIVIDMLLKKFQIKDNRKRFTLYTVYESGGQRRLKNDSYPLLSRLSLGPCEDVAKVFIMDAADQTEIPLEVAQYINFNTGVLQTFVEKFHEEEEREVERIKDKYREYKELLMKRIVAFEQNNNCLKKEE